MSGFSERSDSRENPARSRFSLRSSWFSKNLIGSFLVFLTSFALTFVIGSLVFIPYTQSSSAVDDSASADILIDIAPVLNLTTDTDLVDFKITPIPSGMVGSGELVVTVGTNNRTGYTLTMNSETSDNSLVHSGDVLLGLPTPATIPSTDNITAGTLANNTWGYDVGPMSSVLEDFKAIPLPDGPPDTINSSSAPIEDDETIVTFGARADMNQKVGVYKQTVTFTAVTNPVPPPTVVSVSPTSAAAGNTITITGTNFYAGGSTSGVLRVTIGGGSSGIAAMSCTNRVVTSNTSLTCTVPELEPGVYPVIVKTFGGSSNSDIELTIVDLNPPVLDVYPTTGWTGDSVTITGNHIFSDVSSVTIGGTACSSYTVVSNSKITCVLPAKVSGTTNDIVVTNGTAPGTNVTDASTYTHMKITYFDPTASTVTLNGYTYPYYPNGFTSTNCSSMTPSNTTTINPISPGPNPSIVYVRDTRNNQVYKVKRMIDNKCWMIDNLKYIDDVIQNYDGVDSSGIPNGTAGSVGMIYRNETSTFNTINGTSTQSATNSNKAFYNNPMGIDSCYGGSTSYMATNTTTHCGYLYNWYAATNGTGTYSVGTDGNQVTGNICLANFRLPSGTSGTGGPTTNGTVSTHADFPVLNASMAAGALATGNATTSTFAGWLPGAQWSGTFSGYRPNNFGMQGARNYFWSSTTNSATNARILNSYAAFVYPGTGLDGSAPKYFGLTVRCVLP